MRRGERRNEHPIVFASVTLIILGYFLVSLSVFAAAQSPTSGYSDGSTPSGLRVIVGEEAQIGTSGNSTSFNLTMTGLSTPTGVANNSNYNVSVGYVYTLDRNVSRPSFYLAILNKSQSDVKIRDTINVSVTIDGGENLVIGSISENMTGSTKTHSQAIGGVNFSFSQNISISAGRGNVVNFTAYAQDSGGIETQSLALLITINNTLPSQVVLLAPPQNNVTLNRTPEFAWQNATDADGDALIFNLRLICVGCSADNRDINTTEINHTLLSSLQFLGDDGYAYNWSVQAIDNWSGAQYGYGPISSIRNFSLLSYLSLRVLNGTVNFGSSLSLGEEANTSDETPYPFVIENDGNILANMSIYAEDDLWDSSPNPTTDFMFRAANTSELHSFNWTLSNTSFTPLPTAAGTIIRGFDYRDSQDSAKIDIHIRVPGDETAGEKSSKVVFEARTP
ncbi:MAG TPA: hypothetical protein VJB12_02905 [Candidatus Nanoarchaeia archaeon]|nr:hypothetical protein [Candidatus Nanoarchaeia archaeon]